MSEIIKAEEIVALPAAELQRFSQYVDQLGQLVMAMQRRMDALEKESAQKVTISHEQSKALQKRSAKRAEGICEKYGLDPKADGAAFRAAIKKALLKEYQIKDLHDLPLRSLDGAGRIIDNFTDIALVMERRMQHAQEAEAAGHWPESNG